jgi:hypothetical protein
MYSKDTIPVLSLAGKYFTTVGGVLSSGPPVGATLWAQFKTLR